MSYTRLAADAATMSELSMLFNELIEVPSMLQYKLNVMSLPKSNCPSLPDSTASPPYQYTSTPAVKFTYPAIAVTPALAYASFFIFFQALSKNPSKTFVSTGAAPKERTVRMFLKDSVAVAFASPRDARTAPLISLLQRA